MRGKRAKQLRTPAQAATVGAHLIEYVGVKHTSREHLRYTTVTIALHPDCTRKFYKQLKQAYRHE